MGDFPYKDPDAFRYEGSTLIVRGTKSYYVADDVLPVVGKFFPNFVVKEIDCGHWVISEKPEEFRQGDMFPYSFAGSVLMDRASCGGIFAGF